MGLFEEMRYLLESCEFLFDKCSVLPSRKSIASLLIKCLMSCVRFMQLDPYRIERENGENC